MSFARALLKRSSTTSSDCRISSTTAPTSNARTSPLSSAKRIRIEAVPLEIAPRYKDSTTSTTPVNTTEARQLHDGEQVVHHLLGRLGLEALAQPEELQEGDPPLPLLLTAFLMTIARHALTTTTRTI
jgi:hypothetical protein